MIDVKKYNDPTISSYTVYEDRSKMKEPINIGENGQQLSFGFFDETLKPVPLDPRVGKLGLFSSKLSEDGSKIMKYDNITIEQLSLTENESVLEMFSA